MTFLEVRILKDLWKPTPAVRANLRIRKVSVFWVYLEDSKSLREERHG